MFLAGAPEVLFGRRIVPGHDEFVTRFQVLEGVPDDECGPGTHLAGDVEFLPHVERIFRVDGFNPGGDPWTNGSAPATAGMDLAGALGLDTPELVAFVGAGGKKTAMGQLVAEGGGTNRVGYTTSAHMPPPPDLDIVVDAFDTLHATLRERVDEDTPLALASEYVDDPARVDEKVNGFEPAQIDVLYEAGHFDWLLVKADGARMREFKAPDVDEPPIPRQSTLVVPVASAAAIGAVLSEDVVHRPERVATIAPVAIGDVITPEVVGRVLASDSGGCKHVPEQARVIPVINKADDAEAVDQAAAALDVAFEQTDRFDRGLITSFKHGTLSVHTA